MTAPVIPNLDSPDYVVMVNPATGYMYAPGGGDITLPVVVSANSDSPDAVMFYDPSSGEPYS